MRIYLSLILCLFSFVYSQDSVSSKDSISPKDSFDSKNPNPPKDSQTLHIAVSIAPLTFFVERIAGGEGDKTTKQKPKTQTHIIIPQNKNPESYEPDFATMSAVSKSHLFITIGLPFEKVWLPKIIKSSGKIKSSGSNIRILPLDSKLLESPVESSESKPPKSKPQNTSNDHLWLSLQNAKKISRLIYENISQLDPKNTEFYKQNLESLLMELDDAEREIKQILKNMPRGDFIVYHPLFDTFAGEYGLKEHSLEKHGKKYGVQDVIALSEMGKKLGVKAVFTQSTSRDMQMIARNLNARLVKIDPLSREYIANLKSILEEIAKSYE